MTDSALDRVTPTPTPSRDPGWDRMVRRANVLARSSLVPQHFRGKPDDILVAAIGLESLGVPLNANTLQQVYVVHGRPGYMAQLQIGLCRTYGHDIKAPEDEQTVEAATVYFHRAEWDGDDYRAVTFTMADAVRAKLPEQNATYKSYPDRMLTARAVTKAIALYAPDVMLGIAGTVDADEFSRATRPSDGAGGTSARELMSGDGPGDEPGDQPEGEPAAALWAPGEEPFE